MNLSKSVIAVRHVLHGSPIKRKAKAIKEDWQWLMDKIDTQLKDY